MKPKDRLIVALDVDSLDEAKKLVGVLANEVGAFKIGKELFTRVGPEAVRMVHNAGGKVFLDLKFHDIPNTVAKAVESAKSLGVWMMNVHASGGSAMLRAASDKKGRSILLGVTVLTSMDLTALHKIGVAAFTVEEQVLRLARLCYDANLSGVVASALEAPMIRKALGPNFAIVTPGVRPSGAKTDDQARVVTPGDAIRNGADYIVVGRPITQAANPAEAARQITEELGAK